MIRSICFGLLTLVLASTIALAGGDTKWLHVKVHEKGGDGEMVRVNLPMDLVAKVLPLIEAEGFDRGKVSFDGHELKEVDIRGILEAVKDAEDGEYVTVEGPDENVRVAKKGNRLFVKVEEEGDEPEYVNVEIRMEVVEALLSGEEDELDVLAAVEALAKYGEQELVSVDASDATVRIWVDSRNTSE
jgi:hypothetical protein